jgi:hypothetical protein
MAKAVKSRRPVKVKFEVVVREGKTEPWSGVFDSDQQADKWYENHGRWFEARGKKLIKAVIR